MSLTRLCLGLVALTVLSASASADPIALDASGWSVEFLGSRVTGTVTVVETGTDYVKILVEKDFSDAIWEGGEWDFPVAQLNFTQTGANPVSTIIIDGEDIDNNTGLPWTEFRWNVFPGGNAYIDTAASAGWTVAPMAGWVGLTPQGAGYLTVVASGGSPVPDGATFSPTGGLVVNAAGEFTFKQFPVPEPAALTLILVGAGLAMRRRKRA